MPPTGPRPWPGAATRASRPGRPQRIALEPRRILLQRADPAGLGRAAPSLQVVQGLAGVAGARLEDRGQPATVFDQGVDARALFEPLLHLLARLGAEPATVVHQALA